MYLYQLLLVLSLLLCVFAHLPNPDVGLTAEEKTKFVDLHNEARMAEGASDMYELIWDDHLAITALRWAKECNFTHDFKDNDYGDVLGQNLYIKEGATNKYAAVMIWSAEKPFYNYDTLACSNPPCGHYTQNVWATSERVGCAHVVCPKLWWPSKNKYLADTNNIVCHYWPAGNIVNVKPFTKGEPCSKCDNGKGWCDKGLCQAACDKTEAGCACPGLKCDNCATTDPTTCTCKCQKGFYGKWCEEVCRNLDPGCVQFEPVHCQHETYGKVITQLCPMMCGTCEVQDDKSWTCEGKTWEQVFGGVDGTK